MGLTGFFIISGPEEWILSTLELKSSSKEREGNKKKLSVQDWNTFLKEFIPLNSYRGV